MIAVLLRFMDSFMIYTEPFVLTGGGPGNATTFLSQYLTQKAVGQFDLGPAAAFSLIYFLIILLLCFVLYNWMQRVGTADKKEAGHGWRRRAAKKRFRKRTILVLYLVFAILPVYWMVNMSFKTNEEILNVFSFWPRNFTWDNYKVIVTDVFVVLGLHQLDDLRGDQHGRLAAGGPCPPLRLLALPVPRRQARLLLAAHQPDDAAGGVPAALLPALPPSA